MQAHKPAIVLRPGGRAKLGALDYLDADFISIPEAVRLTKADIERFRPLELRLPTVHYCYVADITPMTWFGCVN